MFEEAVIDGSGAIYSFVDADRQWEREGGGVVSRRNQRGFAEGIILNPGPSRKMESNTINMFIHSTPHAYIKTMFIHNMTQPYIKRCLCTISHKRA